MIINHGEPLTMALNDNDIAYDELNYTSFIESICVQMISIEC